MVKYNLERWITTYFLVDTLKLASCAYLLCYRNTFTNYTTAPIEYPQTLINSSDPCIDVKKSTILFVFGFHGNPHGPAVSTILPTFIGLREHNVILVDWMVEASGGPLGLLGYFVQSVPETKTVGSKLGKALLRLLNLGLHHDIHIIGHSLGAQLAGSAGRETQKYGFTIPWITALDPARLMYNTTSYPTVNASCASFVDIIHCDPGGYSTTASAGHVDIWPNYGEFTNGSKLQPGCSCETNIIDIFTNWSMCNHNRCVFLYNVSLTSPKALEASKADNYTSWLSGRPGSDTLYIGPLIDKRKRGNYYLSTSPSYPWSLGINGLRPNSKEIY